MGLEPTRQLMTLDFKSRASAIPPHWQIRRSTTPHDNYVQLAQRNIVDSYLAILTVFNYFSRKAFDFSHVEIKASVSLSLATPA